MPATMIRPVVIADVPEVVALVRDVLAEFGLVFGVGSQTDEQVRALPGSYVDRGGAFFVAADDGALLGCAGMFPVEAGVYELRKMYLRRSARGRGVGSALWTACLAFARARAAKRIVLDTTEQMKDAIALYERLGFVRDDAYLSGPRCHRGYRLELSAQ
jgi:GNAT superfamily N-acetyltransferase